ncbi:OmpA family protein [Hydrogenophaga sp. ZJX-1]|uniref:OmpA family protein n=1 Tax=Hydrogenophaga sp. ZJX-1 TaxID=3404778 RepID=UPI003B28781A
MHRFKPRHLLAAFALCITLTGCGTPDRGGGPRPDRAGPAPGMVLEVPVMEAFAPGRSAVKPALARQLNGLARRLQGQGYARLRIVGPGDETDRASSNRMLALDRAHSVRDYLIARGLSVTRLQAEGQASNRSLEIHVTVPPGRGAR